MKKKIKKRSVNKSQLEMNVEKKVVNIQPIYEPLKKQKKKKIWKDNQDGEQQGKQRRWVDIPLRMKINIKFIYLILEIKYWTLDFINELVHTP